MNEDIFLTGDDFVSEAELNVIEKITDTATPGPWKAILCRAGETCWCRPVVNEEIRDELFNDSTAICADGCIGKDDAEFVVMARRAIPRLVKVAKAYLLLHNKVIPRQLSRMNCSWCNAVLTGRQNRFCSPACKISEWRRDIKKRAVEYKGGKCERCGYSNTVKAMIFHHPGHKSFGISARGIIRSWDKIKKELDNCVLLCLNCHAEEHS